MDHSPESYLIPNGRRWTCIHLAAAFGGVKYLPLEILTPENLGIQDENGDSPLHKAARSGRIREFPIQKLPLSFFQQRNNQGESVISLAAAMGNLNQLPNHILEHNPIYIHKRIMDWIYSKDKTLPDDLLNPEIWKIPVSDNYQNSVYLHLAARKRLLHMFPDSLLTNSNLNAEDATGQTPLSIAISLGITPNFVKKISNDFNWDHTLNLPEKPTYYHLLAQHKQLQLIDHVPLNALLIKDRSGATVLDILHRENALYVVSEEFRWHQKNYLESRAKDLIALGQIDAIPKDFNWSLRMQDGKTPLHHAAYSGTLHLLPSEAFSEASIKGTDETGLSPLHIAAATGKLRNLPSELLTPEHLSRPDKSGRTPCHIAISAGHLEKLPLNTLSQGLLLISDNEGVTCFHLGAAKQGLGGIPVSLFSREVLLAKDKAGQSVADIIEKHGNTPLIPPHLRNFSKARALVRLKECFSQDFVSAAGLHANELAELINLEEFQLQRRNFVLEWSKNYPDLVLDEEQADAVAEYGPHVQVTARAGSGKTRTLVARALFQIQHCRIPASSILTLAFNKKAVEEIRQRLGKFLSEDQMPHVLTFHALAYRIVKPAEDLIFDEGETKEGQVFSTTIQRIIDEGMRSGVWEKKLRELMQARWLGDLVRIIFMGFNLPQEDFLAFRARLPRYTMDGRRVDTEAHKNVGNALLRMGLRYSYQRVIHRAAGCRYAPDFSHYHKEKDQQFLIEILDQTPTPFDVARQAFWNSDRSTHSHLLQLAAEDCEDPDATMERVARELTSLGLAASPMSDDELWLVLRDDTIRRFTKAAKGFISRCQKEMISPEWIEKRIPPTDPALWISVETSPNRFVRYPSLEGMQIRFWRLSSMIYRRYLEVLAESKQTDFDQVMLDAAGKIQDGKTSFSSSSGRGDIRHIKHVLIDEFQDFSHLFNELRKSIIAQSPYAKFFCVGDDWQAINKFAGSDLRYFTDFTQTFEPSARKMITRNYRSCSKIVEIGNRVMTHMGEPSVSNSSEQGNIWHVEVPYFGSLSAAEECVVEELGDDALAILRIASDSTSRGESVAVLSRTITVGTPESMDKLETWQKRLRSFLPEKDRSLLEVSTTHGYKGKEADVVILLDPEAYPFIHPDAIFNMIFGDTFETIRNDEKRLFYVGVTRPKKALFLLSRRLKYEVKDPSSEIEFLKNSYPQRFDINQLKSNLLSGSRVVVRIMNQNGIYGNVGTYALKDHLKQTEFIWKEERKHWLTILEPGSVNSPFECVQYLNAQPWIKDADGIIVSFTWEDQKHQFKIDSGNIVLDNSIHTALSAFQPMDRSNSSSFSRGFRNAESRQPVGIENEKSNIVIESSDTQTISLPIIQPTQPVSRDSKSEQVLPPSPVPSQGVFRTGVVGMSYEGRMKKAEHLKTGDFVKLQTEPKNRHDRNAIQVVTTDGVQIGYLSKHVASRLAPFLDSWGGLYPAKVISVWKQPVPHFHVAVQICFPLPPGAVIPRELDHQSQWDDDPFVTSGKEPKNTPFIDSYAEASDHPDPVVEPITVSYEGLSQSQRQDLDNLLEPRLAPIIAELYLSGSSDWPQIGYEGRDANNICTGSMLEVAWLDFKVGIALPENDCRSFELAGWPILPAASATVSELRSLFQKGAARVSPIHATSSAEPHVEQSPTGTKMSEEDFIDTIKRIRSGSFYDEEADDDIPF